MTEKLSASEVAGEIRKAYRMFRAFEKGNEMIELLVDGEKSKKALEKEIEKLAAHSDKLQRSVQQDEAQLVTIKKQVSREQERLKVVADEVKAQEASILQAANIEADKILASAKEAKKFLEAENTKAEAELQSLKERQAEDQNDLAALREIIKKERNHIQQFLDA